MSSYTDKPILTVGPDDEEQLRKINIEKYFTTEELAEMGDYEKMRYRRIKQNYQAMLYYGLSISKPSFMQRHQKPLKNSNSCDENEEWTPRLERAKAHQQHKKKCVGKSRKRRKNIKDTFTEDFDRVNKTVNSNMTHRCTHTHTHAYTNKQTNTNKLLSLYA